jgi:hypothetical protein
MPVPHLPPLRPLLQPRERFDGLGDDLVGIESGQASATLENTPGVTCTSTVERPVQALRPKLPRRDPGTLDEALELGPDNLRLDFRPLTRNQRRGKAAISAGNHALAPDDFG